MSIAKGSGAALATKVWMCLSQVLPKGIQVLFGFEALHGM